MRIVLIGAAGQLGRDLQIALPGEVIPLGRDRLDITDETAVVATLEQLAPQIVIHAAAYNLVDRAESEPAEALRVNALGTRSIAQACAALDATLISFSTDYVFGLDAARSEPYRESDSPGPLGVYGTSKLAGEYFVRTLCPASFVVRTCGLYGLWGSRGKGGNFVETMLRLAASGKPLRVVDDQRCTPTFTVDLAAATTQLMDSREYGIYHLTNSGSCTWYEFARKIFELSNAYPEVVPIRSADFAAAARRPPYSVLGAERWLGLSHAPLRPWEEALADYLKRRAAIREGKP